MRVTKRNKTTTQTHSPADARIKPDAVVVEPQHALLTESAVLGVRLDVELADPAELLAGAAGASGGGGKGAVVFEEGGTRVDHRRSIPVIHRQHR